MLIPSTSDGHAFWLFRMIWLHCSIVSEDPPGSSPLYFPLFALVQSPSLCFSHSCLNSVEVLRHSFITSDCYWPVWLFGGSSLYTGGFITPPFPAIRPPLPHPDAQPHPNQPKHTHTGTHIHTHTEKHKARMSGLCRVQGVLFTLGCVCCVALYLLAFSSPHSYTLRPTFCLLRIS